MGFSEIKKELGKLEKMHLIDLISDLYRKNISVKDYFKFYIKPDEKNLLEEYKGKVREGFFPKRGIKPRLSVSRKAINDFKKFEVSGECVADLMLHYVECGLLYIYKYGDDNEQMVLSISNTFEKALELLRKENLLEKFNERTKDIIEETDGIGWGMGDIMDDNYYEYYSN